MRFAITTLGCKVNQYESQLIREALSGAGYDEQEFSLPGAHIYIINTCTVTHRSDADSRKLIRKAMGFDARIVVTGCRAAVYPEEIGSLSERIEVAAFEDLGTVLGVAMPSLITGFSGHSRAFVNVQQGCDNCCTFCIVPKARGVPRSRPLKDILSEIEGLCGSGFQEIILTGINIGLYEGGVAALVREILAHSPMPRIRISSIEPWTVTDELIDLFVKEPRLCRHLHIPLQSGSDAVLSRMGRPYQTRYYRDLLSRILSSIPDVAVGTDVMVGFPGEGEEDFEQTFSLLSGLGFAYLHVFPYSRRPGTPAAGFDRQVDARAAKGRAARLRALSSGKKAAFISAQAGRVAEVLVTHSDGDSFRGMTSNYLRVEVPGRASEGSLVRVLVGEACGDHAWGRLLG